MRGKQDRAKYAQGELICSSMYGEFANCLVEDNIFLHGMGTLYTAYVATYEQPRGWMAKNNTYVCNTNYMNIGYCYETINHIDHTKWKRARISFPYTYESLVWYTAQGVDPMGKYYYYSDVPEAESKQCFFTTGYWVERGGFNFK